MWHQLKGIVSRYYFSLRAYLVIKLYNKRNSVVDKLNCISQSDNVYIVCPGPSAHLISEVVFQEDDSVIFVNHAVDLSLKISTKPKKFFFTADGTRANEIALDKQKALEECYSIYIPFHPFHVRDPKFIIERMDLVLLPAYRLSGVYGLEGIFKSPDEFQSLSLAPFFYGFGSLVSCLQLAIKMNPKNIHLIGCDFGQVGTKRYYSDSFKPRQDTPFGKIHSDFCSVKSKVESSTSVKFHIIN